MKPAYMLLSTDGERQLFITSHFDYYYLLRKIFKIRSFENALKKYY